MTLEAFFTRIPEHEVDKIFEALRHSPMGGALRVQFVNTQAYVLEELARHEVVSVCEDAISYQQGNNFYLLQEYATNL